MWLTYLLKIKARNDTMRCNKQMEIFPEQYGKDLSDLKCVYFQEEEEATD